MGDKKSIIVEKTAEPGTPFEKLCEDLPDGDCRYVVYDVPITTKSGAETNKMIFIMWSDDNSPVRTKMLYASSKDALKKKLTGINDEFQATDRSDLELKDVAKKA